MNITLAYISGIGDRGDGRPVIPFYGILVVGGFFLSWYISNYRAKKDGFKNIDFFSLAIIIPILVGAIVGARLWYVIASFESYAPDFEVGFWNGIWAVLNISNGGLAVQGGVLLAVATGVTLCLIFRKGISILKVTDYIVPTIYIGQIVGRWGNFFNQEVFGHPVTREAWSFLPGFILNNMHNNGLRLLSGVRIPEGSIVAPLFITEGVLNLMMFVLVALALPRVLGKHYRNGDSTFAYFIGYGIVRIALESLRHPAFIMGEGTSSYKSISMSVMFVVLGIIGILLIRTNTFNKIRQDYIKKGNYAYE